MSALPRDELTPAVSPDASCRDAALYYARTLGWRVFPVQPDDKTPYATKDVMPSVEVEKGKGGFHLATTDAATIARWWTRWPTALIGVPIEGWCIVEADVRAGGDVALAEFCALHDIALADTVRATSASGGPHYYFRDVPGLRRAIGVLPGVDFLACGAGFVIVPPSRRTNGAYAWVPGHAPWERPMTPMPAALREAIEQSFGQGTAYAYKAKAAGYAAAPRSQTVTDRNAYIRTARENIYATISLVAAGQRRDVLNRESFTLGRFVGGGYVPRHEARADICAAFASAGHRLDHKAEETIDVALDEGSAQPIRLIVEEKPHRENNGHRENNARDGNDDGEASERPTATGGNTHRSYWTGPSPFNAVLRHEVGWGALVLRTYDEMCAAFGVVMGEPYTDGRPAPHIVLGTDIAHRTEDHINSTNAALEALVAGHYLTRVAQHLRDAGGRIYKTRYVYTLPNDTAWDEWCNDPTLFAAPPRLRTTVASASYRAERAELRRALKEALAAVEAAGDALEGHFDDPAAREDWSAARAAYRAAKEDAAPRKRGRPKGAARQSTPTLADDLARVFSGEPVSADSPSPPPAAVATPVRVFSGGGDLSAAGGDRENNAVFLPFVREENNGCFPGEDEDPFAVACADDSRCFPGEESPPAGEPTRGAADDTDGPARVFSGERPPNDYLGGASTPPEERLHRNERLLRRARTREPMPPPGSVFDPAPLNIATDSALDQEVLYGY